MDKHVGTTYYELASLQKVKTVLAQESYSLKKKNP